MICNSSIRARLVVRERWSKPDNVGHVRIFIQGLFDCQNDRCQEKNTVGPAHSDVLMPATGSRVGIIVYAGLVVRMMETKKNTESHAQCYL